MRKKKIKVNTVRGDGTLKVEAEPISFKGFKERFAIYGDRLRGYTVIELLTGLAVVTSHQLWASKWSKKSCIAESAKKLNDNKNKWGKVLDKAKKKIKRMGIEYPVNNPT